MRIALIVPARLKSSRLAQKMMLNIGPQTILGHVLDRVKKVRGVEVFLATDTQALAEIALAKGIETIMTSSEHQSGTDRVQECVNTLASQNKAYDHIVNVQGDMPFINPQDVQSLVERAVGSRFDITTLATEITHARKVADFNCVKMAAIFEEPNQLSEVFYFSRSPIPYNAPKFFEHIGVYVYTRDALSRFARQGATYLENVEKLEQLRAYTIGLSIGALVVSAKPISVDSPSDYKEACDYYSTHGLEQETHR